MRAMVLHQGKLSVEDVQTPTPGPMQVLARVRACGVCGTDVHAAKSLADFLAASATSGATGWDSLTPDSSLIMGHEIVAEVVATGPGAEAWLPGTRVTSQPVLPDPTAPTGMRSIGFTPEIPGGYAEFILLGVPFLHRVPDQVSDEVAATNAPTAVGLHTIRSAKLEGATSVLVMGAGPIGLTTMMWLKKEGVNHVTVSEPSATRRAIALTLGADLAVDPTAHNPALAISDAHGGAPSIVFDCVGIPGTLQSAIDFVARDGQVVVAGVCMEPDQVRPMVAVNKQLNIQFVRGYTPADWNDALEALCDGSIDTTPMITQMVSLDELPQAFWDLAKADNCKVIVRP